MESRPLPVELVADIFSGIHLKSVYNSEEEWNCSIAFLAMSKSAYKFAGPLFRNKKRLLLLTIANVDEYLAKTEEMLFRVENWTSQRHKDEERRRAIAEEHRKQIQGARLWDSWIFQYHYKVLVWALRREGRAK